MSLSTASITAFADLSAPEATGTLIETGNMFSFSQKYISKTVALLCTGREKGMEREWHSCAIVR